MKTPDQLGRHSALRPGVPANVASCANCLSVIVPAFNEVANIETVLKRVLAQPSVAEVVVVDDQSCDGTWERLKDWPKREARLRLLRHKVNCGKGAAIRTALPYITAKWVVVQDADLEYDPADYGAMLEPILSGKADVVYGSRFLRGDRVTTPLHRVINGALTSFANLFTGLSLTDLHTCMKLFPASLLKAIPLEEGRFGFCPEITAKLAKIGGLRLVEVSIHYQPRTHREGKKIGLRDGLRALHCILKYSS